MEKIDIDIQNEALSLVNSEIAALSRSRVSVTSKVFLDPRSLIEKCRKNYWGVFDKPLDPQTGRALTWIPLTESMVEGAVKNADIDTKDITIMSQKPGTEEATKLVKYKTIKYLDDTYFGEDIDILIRQAAIDGTAVWKTIVVDGVPQRVMVDLLNFYIDPLAKSIQDTPAVIERGLMNIQDFKGMTGWINKETVTTTNNPHPFDGDLRGVDLNTKFVEVYERWGLMPKSFLTGKKSDSGELIEGHIVVSKGNVHLIEKNTDGVKPYEETWWRRVHGRWYGKGIAEMVMFLQTYLNTIVNIRIARSYLSQMGIFKIRKGSGITPQQLSRLAVNGAVEVQNINDIEQFVMQEASSASYSDEANIRSWAERVSSVFEMVTGERLPSGTTATVGSIQASSAQSAFVLIKESIGMFISRYLKRQVFPHISIKIGDIISTADFTDQDREELASDMARGIVNKRAENGDYMSFEQAMLEYNDIKERVMLGKEVFIKSDKDVKLSDFDVRIDITNEAMDKNVLTSNLIQAMSFAPQYADQILPVVFDILNLNLKKPAPQPMMGGLPPEMAEQMKKPVGGAKGATGIMQQANTL